MTGGLIWKRQSPPQVAAISAEERGDIMDDCIFCKIVGGDIPATKVFENENVLAFEDIHPLAPVHVVLVPKRHVAAMIDLGAPDAALVAELFFAANTVARLKGIDKSGFRLVINCGSDGGQVVHHLHLHILGGKKLVDGLG